MFIYKKCRWQHFPEYCCKGYHMRPNERDESPEKKRRVEHAAVARTWQSERQQATKQDIRLMRLGFFDGQLPTQIELERAYVSRKQYVETSEIPLQEQTKRIKKLQSALENITKALQNRTPLPSSDEEDYW